VRARTWGLLPDSARPADQPMADAISSPVVDWPVKRWRKGAWEITSDQVAEETPVAITYNSIPHVVMLASPGDLIDLAYGFTMSEALVDNPAQIRGAELHASPQGPEVAMAISHEKLAQVLDRRRNLTGRTGCGVCGAETIEDAIRYPPPVSPGGQIAREALAQALVELRGRQPLNALAGSLHAAAWVSWSGEIQVVREDVGRHNALDKVIGALLRNNADLSAGFAVVTSRASYELVQKTATLGIRMLVAVSAPTALALRLASRTGLTLVGFAREEQQVVYANPERLS
jgi:FdhD protein